MIRFEPDQPSAPPPGAPDIVTLMAARIRELGDGVTAETLESEFTSHEVKKYGREAADLAIQQRVRRAA